MTIWNEMGECMYNCLDWSGEDCTLPWQLVLIDPQSLGELFEYEPVTIVRQVGSVMLRPWLARGNPCDVASWGLYQNWLRNHFHLRAGLVKQRTSTFEQTGIHYDPSNSDDWSESPWRRTWEHQWLPRPTSYGTQFQNEATVFACSNVTKSSVSVPGWTLATGSGNWLGYTEPAISTSCQNFTLSEGCGQLPFQSSSEFPFWRLSLNSRRRIFMSESDRLDIWVAISQITSNSNTCDNGVGPCFNDLAASPPCNIQLYTNYKILVEYG